MTGADIRRYRKAIGWSQRVFAERLGISQSALSFIEGGRMAMSEVHLSRLAKMFDGSQFKPRFSDFAKGLEREQAEGQAALLAPMGRQLALTVWTWGDGFDLSRVPTPDLAVGAVTVGFTINPTIALQMDRATELWVKGEIFVFERCQSQEVEDGDICLLQVKLPRARATKTMIATAHIAPSTRGHTLQFGPISPAGPVFTADETILATLRATFRGRYLKK